MHEYSLMSGLMNKVQKLAIEQNATRVVAVKIRMGSMAHVSPDHLREHFLRESKGTKAEGARLDIEQFGDIHDSNAQAIVLESIEVA